jgi:hypothetical protein
VYLSRSGELQLQTSGLAVQAESGGREARRAECGVFRVGGSANQPESGSKADAAVPKGTEEPRLFSRGRRGHRPKRRNRWRFALVVQRNHASPSRPASPASRSAPSSAPPSPVPSPGWSGHRPPTDSYSRSSTASTLAASPRINLKKNTE